MDGSADARADSGSWIREAENATGRKRGRCSYEGCNRPAEVGGHIWIKQQGCFIAPICSKCNHPKNADRMQGAQARLRAKIDVTEAEQTLGMQTAQRRFAVAVRECELCGADITDRPDNHKVCLSCFRNTMQVRKRKRKHLCESCRDDISDRPDNHNLCLSCFRDQQTISTRTAKRRIMVTSRQCELCGVDITNRPRNHKVCPSCFKSGAHGRQSAYSKRPKEYEDIYRTANSILREDYAYEDY